MVISVIYSRGSFGEDFSIKQGVALGGCDASFWEYPPIVMHSRHSGREVTGGILGASTGVYHVGLTEICWEIRPLTHFSYCTGRVPARSVFGGVYTIDHNGNGIAESHWHQGSRPLMVYLHISGRAIHGHPYEGNPYYPGNNESHWRSIPLTLRLYYTGRVEHGLCFDSRWPEIGNVTNSTFYLLYLRASITGRVLYSEHWVGTWHAGVNGAAWIGTPEGVRGSFSGRVMVFEGYWSITGNDSNIGIMTTNYANRLLSPSHVCTGRGLFTAVWYSESSKLEISSSYWATRPLFLSIYNTGRRVILGSTFQNPINKLGLVSTTRVIPQDNGPTHTGRPV